MSAGSPLRRLPLIIIAITLACFSTLALAQGKAAVPAKGPATRIECAEAFPLCVTVPAAWQRIGSLFDGLGFVVAEPQKNAEQASWPQLSVAAIDVPPAKAGAPPRSLDSLVDLVLTPDGSFSSAETLQRSHVLLNGADAEILRVRLHQAGGSGEAIEELALIAGDEEMVYSIALRCAEQELPRLDPIFQKAARSWHIKAQSTEIQPAKPVAPKPGARQP